MPEAALQRQPGCGRAERNRGGRTTANLRAAAVCIALLLSAPIAAAQSIESAPEHSIKAAYLYNFASYVDWPPAALDSPDAPFAIGVLGDEQIAAELVPLMRGRQVHGRPIAVRQVQSGDELAGLHVLFIGRESAPALARLLDDARDNSVLVVTEWDGALEAGSAINFRLVDQRVRFEVSVDAADAGGLAISSRMLAVAERVVPRSGE